MTRRILISLLTLGLSICIALSILATIAAVVLMTTPGASPGFF